jgi:hypothetical protein
LVLRRNPQVKDCSLHDFLPSIFGRILRVDIRVRWLKYPRFVEVSAAGFRGVYYSVSELLGGNSQVLPETNAARTAAREHHAVEVSAKRIV